LVRTSKILLSKLALYWAGLTTGFAILWSVIINYVHLTGTVPAISLIIPMILAAVSSVLLYFERDHLILEYDDDWFLIKKGRRETAKHYWTEFKECSIVRDNYSRNKVRVYFERDGRHLDIDSSACGMDSYRFRDFILDRIRSPRSSQSSIIEGLEREIQRGRASWVADLSETFKNYQISGEVFPLVARGGTRPKGFLLSRFIAYTIMPNYNVCLYTCEVGQEKNTKSEILRLVRIIETQRHQKDVKWSWLLLLSDDDPPSATASMIEQFGNKDVGIGCINMMTGRVITSPNQLGRSLTGQMRMNRLIRDIRRRKLPGTYPSTR
jgi:hypothetical protein